MAKKSSKKAKRATSVSEEPIQTPNGAPEDIIEPETSPYLTEDIKLIIGPSQHGWTVHRHFVEQSPVLKRKLDSSMLKTYFPSTPLLINLIGVDVEIAHTFIHYLYTREYQTLRPRECDGPKELVEYGQSVLAFRAAKTYELPGLEDEARAQMERLDEYVHIHMILDLAREVYRQLPIDSNEWYSLYLREKLKEAFEEDEELFSQDYFTQGLGQVSIFDKFLVATMVSLFMERISMLKEASPRANRTDQVTDGYPEFSTSPPPELPPDPNGTLSDQCAPESSPGSSREPSPEPAQPDIAEEDEEDEQDEQDEQDEDNYDGLEPIPEDVGDYGGNQYDGYRGIAQECM
ncbi:hypothetical protein DTO164E3_3970 [Paecilomyces variotii]|nr:hypothetical protein DTO164E3_3970 [Paecilomyces variotii]KAJ9326290.1 hypothetical protein DTO027B3_2604 [Paecilomyces variotii]KAJ9330302.1 hypothetical protein DTO027B5_7939 [Paecilomyces variotii]